MVLLSDIDCQKSTRLISQIQLQTQVLYDGTRTTPVQEKVNNIGF